MQARAVLGLNQYTHSAACCLLGPDGELLFALAKERLTRKKWDGGDTAELVEHALAATGLAPDDLACVVANNHLFRIRPFEKTLPWAVALHQQRPSCLSPFNLLPGVPKHELSHHLAHAWSVMPQVPFDSGLIVVMDGIGSSLRDVIAHGPERTTDASLPQPGPAGSVQTPASADPHWGWREAETAYTFEGLELRPCFKRWIRERTPDFLYNYGFEDMESLGAVYSRISSHVFGDWNTCGKVMGLAPWDAAWNEAPDSSEWLLRGPLDGLEVNWPLLLAEPHPNEWQDTARHARYARLAGLVQRDVETVVLEFLGSLRERTGARNLALAGGVALNSTLNGRIARECGFDTVFVPPYPGDDGIAVGCALFGRHAITGPAPPRRRPFSPFQGREYADAEIEAGLAEHADWTHVLPVPPEQVLAETARVLGEGRVVGWWQGRGELGPRALGNRSLLADPRRAEMVAHLNERIKGREGFRPFAPAVLAEAADAWFEGVMPSPYMSVTVPVRAEKRAEVPAIVHVDGTARLQTLVEADNPRFHALISAFAEETGVPLLLNTSFNLAGEPIVESPGDALRSFLASEIDLLVLGDRIVARRPFPEPAAVAGLRPRRDPSATSDLTSSAEGEPLQVRMLGGGRSFDSEPLEVALFEACDGDETVAELLAGFEEQFEAPPAATLERLERLWRRRLVRLGAR